MLRRPFLFLVVSMSVAVLAPSSLIASVIAAPGRKATIVDVNLADGAVRASGPDPNTAATPGSTLKPLLLMAALRMGVVTPQTRILCTGNLRDGGRNLACAHPTGLGVLNAEEALAYSCNTYFARLAEHLPSHSLRTAFKQYGMDTERSAETPSDRVTLALGLDGVAVTPLQLAAAYVRLARDLAPNPVQSETVRDGLLGSVSYGMAHAAATSGVLLGGKTGTAHDSAPALQHGWFAGIVFAPGIPPRPEHVIVAYLPGGTGNDAAAAARRYLEQGRK